MSSLQLGTKVIRKSFGKVKDIVPVPDLIEIQSKSFNDFVQLDMLPSERAPIGLEKVLRDIFPIEYGDKMSAVLDITLNVSATISFSVRLIPLAFAT